MTTAKDNKGSDPVLEDHGNTEGWLAKLDVIINAMILKYEHSRMMSVIVPVTLFLVIPIMALGNVVQGGSPFMLLCYLAIAAGIVAQIVMTGARPLAGICNAISCVSAILIMVALPFYAAMSLTIHILHSTFTDGIIECLLIAVVVYVACAGTWTLVRRSPNVDAISTAERAIAYVLFALPFCYILYWFITFAVQFIVPSGTARDGASLVISVAIGSFAFSLLKLSIDQVANSALGKVQDV